MTRPLTTPVLAAASLAALAALATAETARAQVDPAVDAASQLLYDQATVAMDKGDYATACPKLAEVVRLKPDAVGAKLTLAECHEGAGRRATAWAAYAAAESAAANAGQMARAKKAGAKAEALKDKLATITVVVPAALREAEGLDVQRDDMPIGAALWDVPIPVDRGRHTITVYATGHKRWSRDLDTPDGDHATVTIAVGEAKPTSHAATSPTPGSSPGIPPRATPAPPPPLPPSRSWVLPGAAIGATAVGFGVMGVAAGMLMSTRTTLDTECPGKVCTQAGLDALSTGQTLNVVGSVGFGVGVAGLAGFLTWLAWPSSRRPVGSARTPLAVASW